jgi:hypothetical protein
VRLSGPEIGERQRDRFGGHRGTPASVDGQLPATDALLSADGGDQLLGKDRGLSGSDRPADDQRVPSAPDSPVVTAVGGYGHSGSQWQVVDVT